MQPPTDRKGSAMHKLLTVALIAAMSAPAAAVDLLGVYELASSNDPQIRAAERRLDAAQLETDLARANFLPQINSTLQRTPVGESQPKIAGVELQENDIDTENYSVNLTQSLFDYRNFAEMERARRIIAQADARYGVAWQDFLQRTASRYFDMLNAIDNLRSVRAGRAALRGRTVGGHRFPRGTGGVGRCQGARHRR
jgi:outer membrane protein